MLRPFRQEGGPFDPCVGPFESRDQPTPNPRFRDVEIVFLSSWINDMAASQGSRRLASDGPGRLGIGRLAKGGPTSLAFHPKFFDFLSFCACNHNSAKTCRTCYNKVKYT